MNPESLAATQSSAAGCESKEHVHKPVADKTGTEGEISTPPSNPEPKQPPSFYETIYYWLMARH
jgi:hypothetical protein